MKRTSLIFVSTLTLALTWAGAAPGFAAITEPSMQDRVAVVLAGNPGSVQTGWNEVTMSGGDPVLALESSRTDTVLPASVGTCPNGKFCAYGKMGYRGDKLTYSTCTANHSVAGLIAVRSIANSRATGTVRAYNGSTVVASVAAGTGENLAGKTTWLTCS